MNHQESYTVVIEIDGELRVTAAHQELSLRRLNQVYARMLVSRVKTKAQVCKILGITDKTLNRLLREDADL